MKELVPRLIVGYDDSLAEGAEHDRIVGRVGEYVVWSHNVTKLEAIIEAADRMRAGWDVCDDPDCGEIECRDIRAYDALRGALR